jgi:hypothetical protein
MTRDRLRAAALLYGRKMLLQSVGQAAVVRGACLELVAGWIEMGFETFHGAPLGGPTAAGCGDIAEARGITNGRG